MLWKVNYSDIVFVNTVLQLGYVLRYINMTVIQPTVKTPETFGKMARQVVCTNDEMQIKKMESGARCHYEHHRLNHRP